MSSPECLNFWVPGKLMLSGEYVVLDGAASLALPTKKGQSMRVQTSTERELIWSALDLKGECWLQCHFDQNLELLSTSDEQAGHKLQHILKTAERLSGSSIISATGFSVETRLEFERAWGLGSSSTLITLISKWLNTNPLELLNESFNGSGYDVAVSLNQAPTRYVRTPLNNTTVRFTPGFKEHLFFVYLDQKQDSQKEVAQYLNHNNRSKGTIEQVTEYTDQMLNANALEQFESTLEKHEQLLGSVLNQQPVQERLFNDYKLGKIKSLGAWGGDFVLATAQTDPRPYFASKGYKTVIAYADMILDSDSRGVVNK